MLSLSLFPFCLPLLPLPPPFRFWIFSFPCRVPHVLLLPSPSHPPIVCLARSLQIENHLRRTPAIRRVFFGHAFQTLSATTTPASVKADPAMPTDSIANCAKQPKRPAQRYNAVERARWERLNERFLTLASMLQPLAAAVRL
ncbi:hypothetical protein DFH08DRAFT_875582 [Mycena albidolilacea]|uniref:Uncharacterized protein n=1 Tax=Mycena albidolilacea TaxID=1033008 RepID=A0AAD6ZU60_9AGAR|nr:hypothetical protein DFH08DRAFT_875582 [Mycena albidolilacea]